MPETATKQLAQQLQYQRVVERALDNFKKLGRNNLTAAKVRSRISALEQSWRMFLNGHVDLSLAVNEATQRSIAYFTENNFERTEDAYQDALDYMNEALEELEPPVSPNRTVEHVSVHDNEYAVPRTALPAINLPPFDGDCDKWEHFRDRFTTLIIDKKELRNFARMHYLTSSLTGRALDCVQDLKVTAENFPIAWKRLCERFEDKQRLLGVHLSALLDLPSLPRESACDLETLLDKVKFALAALTNLNRSKAELWDDIIIHIVRNKLDSITRKAWNFKSDDDDEPPSCDAFLEFLRKRARSLGKDSQNKSLAKQFGNSNVRKISASTASTSVAGSSPSFNSVSAAGSSASTASVSATVSSPSPCPVCKARHFFSACPSFVSGNPSQRRDLVKQHKRCFNCLSNSHAVRDCRSKYSCRVCHQKHHTMLHTSSDSGSNSAVTLPSPSDSPKLEPQSQVHSMLASTKETAHSNVLLATAWISIRGSSGRTLQVRALLDQGSEMTFISESVAQLLRGKRVRMPVSISAVGGVQAGTFHYAIQIAVSPLGSASPAFSTTALILPRLTSYAPKCVAGASSLAHLRDLQWADSDPTSSDPIQIIIGADLYSDILLEGVRKGDKAGAPIAQRTIFGWVISGPIGSTSVSSITTSPGSVPVRESSKISVHHCATTSSLEEEIKRFWEVEELPQKSFLSADDEACENHFRETHSRAADGRYIVRLPFKKGPPIEIGDSRFRAIKFLDSLTRRLRTNTEHATEYCEFLGDYERRGHMREAPSSSEARDQIVYIPHHPVIRADSVTTHLRVVFNASSITSNGSSLNDHLHSGPKLQTDLPAVILRWRNFQFVYTADISKMYRQILVDSRDVDYQRILWQPASADAPREYQLLTVTYGMACAPYLALRVIQQLASDEGQPFPLAVAILKDHIYVDDVLFGGDDLTLLRKTRDQLIALLRRGGFELRKWASNSALLISDIDAADHGLACSKTLSPDEKLKILGVGWNPALDVFQFRVSIDEDVPTSKRSILSTIAKLYDPLGWVTPVTVAAKILLQQLWKLQLAWDEIVPSSVLIRWKQIYSRLSCLNGLQISRWTGIGAGVRHAELHGFADASNAAYAAVVYLKVISVTGKVTITLLVGKSKVAPLKLLSIPRLELTAAGLLARLIDFVRESLDLSTLPCFCWTDSTIVLAWLDQHPSRWKTFVANRVADIQSRLPTIKWQHVSTDDNPADCASRGLLGDEILTHALWWQGPPWLKLPHEEWPVSNPSLPADAPLEKKIVALHIAPSLQDFDLASRYSSWSKLIRVTAYLFKFISLCRRVADNSQSTQSTGFPLTATAYRQAKMFWIKRIQAEVFPRELAALSTNQSISAKSHILSLRPFLDRDGILRVGGRLGKSPVPFDTRHPVLLAPHPLVRLIISQVHLRMLHSGVQLTLSTLRREYWLIRARNLVKAEIHACVTCVRERAAIPSQLMGDLPEARVSAPMRCFAHCGIDYAGPVLVRASAGRGIKSVKAYIALFICLSTRAIHLELVSDYSTSAFLNAYSRFCSRRGLPQAMYSDNGTTFVGADRELASAYRDALRDPSFQNKTAADNVAWHFIPPSAPHFGGIWEAGVRSMKHHMRRVLGSHTLTFEELATLLCRIEACLNSRPIAPLSDTWDDHETLTPGHFLIGSPITVNPEPSTLDVNENRLSRWKLVRHITERFWKLWQTDYINTLQQRGKWRKVQPSIRVGQLVLLRNSALPPCKWEIGRVIQDHPGSDGLTRVVTVKTASAEYKRPIGKLCILPVMSESKCDE